METARLGYVAKQKYFFNTFNIFLVILIRRGTNARLHTGKKNMFTKTHVCKYTLKRVLSVNTRFCKIFSLVSIST